MTDKTTLVVRVTEDHIDRGRRNQASHCPIALALEERTDSIAIVGLAYIHTRFGYATPSPRAAAFIVAFDHGGPAHVHPTTFRFTFR